MCVFVRVRNVPVCYCRNADKGYDSNSELNSGSSCSASGGCQNLLAAAAPNAASAGRKKCIKQHQLIHLLLLEEEGDIFAPQSPSYVARGSARPRWLPLTCESLSF